MLDRITEAVAERIGFYVYRLIDPRDQKTLYIGKGKGDRIGDHLREARKKLDRSSTKLLAIRQLAEAGLAPAHIIHRHGLTEKEALEVEAALIDAFPDALNEVSGHHSGERGAQTMGEIIASYAPEAVTIKERAIVIIINREWHRGLPADPEALYERTRRYWYCEPQKHNPDFAFCVAKEVIRQVYRIHQWHSVDLGVTQIDPGRRNLKQLPKQKLRWELEGEPALEMAHYIGKTVEGLARKGAANPIRWMNC